MWTPRDAWKQSLEPRLAKAALMIAFSSWNSPSLAFTPDRPSADSPTPSETAAPDNLGSKAPDLGNALALTPCFGEVPRAWGRSQSGADEFGSEYRTDTGRLGGQTENPWQTWRGSPYRSVPLGRRTGIGMGWGQ